MATKVAVIGDGAMGTACSILLASHPDQQVSLWSVSEDYSGEMRERRENVRFLPGVRIPAAIELTGDIEQAARDAELLVAAVPTVYLRTTLENIRSALPPGRPVVSVIKGLETETFMRPSEIIGELLGQRAVVVLCGPSHAEEISRNLPATVVAASGDLSLAKQVQRRFSTERFRVYTNSDPLGVELAGALKNVMGIAAGLCDGLQFGDNAKAALLTRGLVEMMRFGLARGAERATFLGLAGMGDMITTCYSPYGRNRGVGEALGKGRKLADVLGGMKAVAEGVWTTRSVHDLAEQLGIDMPITQEVYRILFEDKDPLEAVNDLMMRKPKSELE